MAFWESLAEGTMTGFMSGVGSMFKDIRVAITGKEPMTSEQQAELLTRLDAIQAQLAKYEHEVKMGQLELNKIDASSGSMFKGGWRPALGWACVMGVAYQFVFRPIGTWTLKMFMMVYAAYSEAGFTPAFKILMDEVTTSPSLDMQTLLAILGTLLGVGVMRTTEKIKGVAAK